MASSSAGSIWLSPAITAVTSDPVGERAPVAGDDRRADALVALVRDHLDARVGAAARALGGRVVRSVVDDVDAVDEGRDAGESRADQRSSSCAGTTTATVLPSSIGGRRAGAGRLARGSPRGAPRMSPISAPTSDRVPRARADVFAPAAGDDSWLLDLLGEREQLPGLQAVLLERSAPLLRGQEQGAHRQLLDVRRAAHRSLGVLNLLVDCRELAVVGGELLLKGLPLEPRVAADLVLDPLGDRCGCRADLTPAVALDRDDVELAGNRPGQPAPD